MNQPPFYPNPDDTHCWQCCLRMVLEYFSPSDRLSWAQWDELTGKKEGLWSWPLKGLLAMEEKGFDVVVWEDFDYERFTQLGDEYLRERFGEEIAQEQIKNSDISFEMQVAKQLLDTVQPPSVPSLEDLKDILEKGYLVICNVNLRSLNENDGYEGHFVTVYGVTDQIVLLNDPGPPAHQKREVPIPIFVQSWEASSPRDKNIMAFKLKDGKIAP